MKYGSGSYHAEETHRLYKTLPAQNTNPVIKASLHIYIRMYVCMYIYYLQMIAFVCLFKGLTDALQHFI